MNKITRITLLGLLGAFAASAQLNSLVQTSTSAAITASQTTINVASATGINAATVSVPGSALYIADIGQSKGEVVIVNTVTSTTLNVRRGASGTKATAHVSGAMVLVATAPNWFYSTNPQGSCVAASVYASPWLNVLTGEQWLCSAKTLAWSASWGAYSGNPQVLSATATASVGGATAVAGPLVEISGTNAITSFTMSTGWNGQSFCVFPTGAFTVTATNNIAKAATAVANRTLCFTYDANASTAGFSPSY